MKSKAESGWYSMIHRCSSSYKEVRASYKNCHVDVKFEDKAYFIDWWNSQQFSESIDDNGKSYHLDKEILVPGNTRYGPDTCVFVPSTINSFYSFIDSNFNDSVGATFNKTNNKWSAAIKLCPLQSRKYLGGTYESKEEAHSVYCKAKDAHARWLANYFVGKVDDKVIFALNNFSTREQIECYAKNKL